MWGCLLHAHYTWNWTFCLIQSGNFLYVFSWWRFPIILWLIDSLLRPEHSKTSALSVSCQVTYAWCQQKSRASRRPTLQQPAVNTKPFTKQPAAEKAHQLCPDHFDLTKCKTESVNFKLSAASNRCCLISPELMKLTRGLLKTISRMHPECLTHGCRKQQKYQSFPPSDRRESEKAKQQQKYSRRVLRKIWLKATWFCQLIWWHRVFEETYGHPFPQIFAPAPALVMSREFQNLAGKRPSWSFWKFVQEGCFVRTIGGNSRHPPVSSMAYSIKLSAYQVTQRLGIPFLGGEFEASNLLHPWILGPLVWEHADRYFRNKSKRDLKKKNMFSLLCIIPKDMPSRWMKTILVFFALQTFWKLNQVSGRVDRHLAHLRVWVQQTENTFAARAPGYHKFTHARMKRWLWDIWRKRINDDKW